MLWSRASIVACALIAIGAAHGSATSRTTFDAIAEAHDLTFFVSVIRQAGMEKFFGRSPVVTVFAPVDGACTPDQQRKVLASQDESRAFVESHLLHGILTLQTKYLARDVHAPSANGPLRVVYVSPQGALSTILPNESMSLPTAGGAVLDIKIYGPTANISDVESIIRDKEIIVAQTHGGHDSVIQRIAGCELRIK